MMRGTGGNHFIPADATHADLMRSINDQLGDMQEWADDTGRKFDLAEVTIHTRRIPSGLISVSVEADLVPTNDPRRPAVDDEINQDEVTLLRAQVKAAHDLLDEWDRKHTHLGIERGHYGPSSDAWRVIFPTTSPEEASRS